MKSKLIAPRNACRQMEAGPDLDRLLAGGSWLIAAPKARTKKAAEMRALRRARRAEGWSSFTLWVAPEQLAAIKAALRPGESYVELLVRLIEEQRSLL